MKKILFTPLLALTALIACNNKQEGSGDPAAADEITTAGQEAVKDDESAKDVIKVAVGSTDHTTLVVALKQAELVTSLSNAGPFTVFAPTNAAFDKLPAGTVEDLMKDDKKADLENILQYHVTTSTLKTEFLTDGMTLGMVNGDNVSVTIRDEIGR